jgi:hypothetical protein
MLQEYDPFDNHILLAERAMQKTAISQNHAVSTAPSAVGFERGRQSVQPLHSVLDLAEQQQVVGLLGQLHDKVTQKVKTQKSRLLRWNLLS